MNSGYVLKNTQQTPTNKEKEDKTKYAFSCNLNENCSFGLRSGNAETNTLKLWQELNVWNEVSSMKKKEKEREKKERNERKKKTRETFIHVCLCLFRFKQRLRKMDTTRWSSLRQRSFTRRPRIE